LSEWKEGIWIAVSAILISLFFMFLNTVVMAVRETAKIEQENINNVLILKDHFKIGRYDNSIVGQEDVINCIMEYKSKVPSVIVDNKVSIDSPNAVFNLNLNAYFILNYDWDISNEYYLWDGTMSSYDDYKLEELITYIPYIAKYRARLIKDENGDVIHIWFSRIT